MSEEKQKIHWGSYLVLLVAVVMFSGALTKAASPWNVMDFMTLVGKFGTIVGGKGTFLGSGGDGARGGFLFCLSLCPAVIFALGLVRIVDGYGGLAACERLISPLFRKVLDIPGASALAFITSLQSSDGGGAMAKSLFDSKIITDRERTLLMMLIFSGSGTITNYFSSIGGIFVFFIVPVSLPLAVIFVCKIIGVQLMRLVLALDSKKNPAPGA